MKPIELVLLLNIIVVKSWAMTRSELDEFSDFLEKTSQLDLNLKSNPDVDADEDDTVPDNAWEESGKFEGDLILNERQRRLIVEDVAEGLSRNGLRDSTKRWPDNEVVYFIQREHFSEDQLQAIQNGIDDIAQASCVKFRPYRKGDRDAVVIQGSRRGCFSQVGYQSGYQVLNLNSRHPVGRGCFRHGTVVHELLHTLGFYHMQSSPDRDDYIDVMWENILQPARHNFRKYNTFAVSDFGVGYDYDSVLHYSKKAFSSNGQDTLVPKQNGVDIGQRVGLSEKDTQKLNKMYCDADSNSDDVRIHIPKKKKNKNKSPKNKPFEGHGIGYHQGKTVVIKLPAAETYRLPDIPTFHIFDHFSKAPQTMPETHIGSYGFGEKIKTSNDPAPTKFDEVQEMNAAFDVELTDIHNKKKINKDESLDSVYNIKQMHRENNDRVQNGSKNQRSHTQSQEEYTNEKSFKDVRKTFERLNEDIKNRVYPSEKEGDYKIKNDYSNFNFKENSNIKDEPLMNTYSSTAEGKEKTNNKNDKNDNVPHKLPNAALYATGIEDSNSNEQGKLRKRVQSDDEMDSMFRTSLPRYHSNYFIKDEDVDERKDTLYQRNNYTNMYLQNREGDIRHHELFGENVPTNEDWNNNDEFKRHIGDYNIASYTNKDTKDYMSTQEMNKNVPKYFRRPEIEDSNSYAKNSHHIFGVPVPLLTYAWYKKNNVDNSYSGNVSDEESVKRGYTKK